MLAGLQHTATLWLKSKSGLTVGVFVFLGMGLMAAIMLYVFLCVTACAWLSAKLGAVFGSLATAGFFLVVALMGFAMAALTRQRAQHRATLERAARTRGSTLIDPKVLKLSLQAGRRLGWHRVIPVALVGFLVTQWAQEARHQSRPREAI